MGYLTNPSYTHSLEGAADSIGVSRLQRKSARGTYNVCRLKPPERRVVLACGHPYRRGGVRVLSILRFLTNRPMGITNPHIYMLRNLDCLLCGVLHKRFRLPPVNSGPLSSKTWTEQALLLHIVELSRVYKPPPSTSTSIETV